MNMKQPSNTWLSNWLENLQRESWQLELIISGFAILLLSQGLEAGGKLDDYSIVHLPKNGAHWLSIGVGLSAILGAGWVMLVNLCIHVVLRGLWIGTVGLRSISQTIDYEQLNYSDKFKAYLSRKVGSYDEYILRLERLCSVVFVYSFLVAFAFIGFVLSLIALFIITATLSNLEVG